MEKLIVDPRTSGDFEDLSEALQISLLKEYLNSVKGEITKVTAQQQETEKLRNDLAYQKAKADLLQESMGAAPRPSATPVRKGAFGLRDIFSSEAAETPSFGKPSRIHSMDIFGFSTAGGSDTAATRLDYSTPAPASVPARTSSDPLLGSGSGSASFGYSAGGGGSSPRPTSPIGAAGGFSMADLVTAIQAMGPVLGEAMQQNQLPRVSLKSFSMEDISRFIKDIEAYRAVGGPKRMAEFLGGTQLRDLKDAIEAAGFDRVITTECIRAATDEQMKAMLFSCIARHLTLRLRPVCTRLRWPMTLQSFLFIKSTNALSSWKSSLLVTSFLCPPRRWWMLL